MQRYRVALCVLLAVPLLAACGNVAGANTPPPPPTLPPAPPLDPTAAAVLSTPLPTVPPAPTPEAATQSEVLFADDFADGTLDGWTVVDFSEGPAGPATWLVEGGVVLQGGDGTGLPDPGATYLLAGDGTWADYALQADTFVDSATPIGLIARRSTSGYYRARLDVDQGRTAAVIERVDAQPVTHEIARAVVPFATHAGRWIRMRLELQGQRLTLFLDGQQVLQAQDTNLSAGQAGLFATAEMTARFDNATVVAR